MFSQTVTSPAGEITVEANSNAVTRVRFGSSANQNPNKVTGLACEQLADYFNGKLVDFNLPLETKGTDFQKSVWAELAKIPKGKTISYGEIANKIGKPKAARAVGRAVGSNPIAIIIPCHRVMASNGAITGYTGGEGVITKAQLLKLEGVE